jgi:nitronate monooxygenase
MWPRAELLDLLGIEHPIIQAPMAGSATPELAAAVCNAGGLGSLPCGEKTQDEIKATVERLRAATDRPFNLNFFAHETPKAKADVAALTRKHIAPFYEEFDLGDPPPAGKAPFGTFGAETVSLLLDIKPAVAALHEAGCRILWTATTVAEARSLAAAGVDAIIAQGWEAGGHRGTFHVSFEDFGVGTLALVPQIVDAVEVPVIAAGGIADGRGIAAAFALGASGVQMGTAFLSCPEARVSDMHRNALRHASDEDTRLTRAFSGRPARAKNNRYIDAMAEHRAPVPDFPTMYGFSGPLLAASAAKNDPNFQFLLYGQAAALNRELPAGELVQTLVDEARTVLARR